MEIIHCWNGAPSSREGSLYLARADALHLLTQVHQPPSPHLVCQANLPTTPAFFNILGSRLKIAHHFHLFSSTSWLAGLCSFYATKKSQRIDFVSMLHVVQVAGWVGLGMVGFCKMELITEAGWWDLCSCRWRWPWWRWRWPSLAAKASFVNKSATCKQLINFHAFWFN